MLSAMCLFVLILVLVDELRLISVCVDDCVCIGSSEAKAIHRCSSYVASRPVSQLCWYLQRRKISVTSSLVETVIPQGPSLAWESCRSASHSSNEAEYDPFQASVSSLLYLQCHLRLPNALCLF